MVLVKHSLDLLKDCYVSSIMFEDYGKIAGKLQYRKTGSIGCYIYNSNAVQCFPCWDSLCNAEQLHSHKRAAANLPRKWLLSAAFPVCPWMKRGREQRISFKVH